MASGVGAAVTAIVSSSPWPRGIYLVFGVIAFLAFSLVQAAASDGHPDHRYPWLAPSHALISALIFAVPLAKRHQAVWWKRSVASIIVLCAGLLAYGAARNYMTNTRLQSLAQMNERATTDLWLPAIFKKPPTITWQQTELTEHEYNVRGLISSDASAYLEGQSEFATGAVILRSVQPNFKVYPNEKSDHYLERLRNYLRQQNCTEQLVSNLKMSGRTHKAYYGIPDVLIDPANPAKGKHTIYIYCWPQDDSLSFTVEYTDANPYFVP